MTRRAVLYILIAAFMLGGTLGASRLAALAQKVTTAAVSPPQDLLPDPLQMPEGEAETTRLNGVDIYYQVFGEGSRFCSCTAGCPTATTGSTSSRS